MTFLPDWEEMNLQFCWMTFPIFLTRRRSPIEFKRFYRLRSNWVNTKSLFRSVLELPIPRKDITTQKNCCKVQIQPCIGLKRWDVRAMPYLIRKCKPMRWLAYEWKWTYAEWWIVWSAIVRHSFNFTISLLFP